MQPKAQNPAVMPSHAKQHFVPTFLLKHWHSRDDARLTVFRWVRDEFRHDRHSAKAVAHDRHLYSMARGTAEPDTRIEREFMGPAVDEPAADAHRYMLERGLRSMTKKDQRAWIAFTVSLMVRMPPVVDQLRSRGREVLREALAADPEAYEQIRGDAVEATLDEWVTNHAPNVFDDLGVMMLPQVIHSRLLNGAFHGSTWALRGVSRARHDLLISDRPLFRGGGLSGDFLVALPISPSLAFLAFKGLTVWRQVQALSDNQFVRAFNRTTVTQAETFVYATGVAQASFVQKYLRKLGPQQAGT